MSKSEGKKKKKRKKKKCYPTELINVFADSDIDLYELFFPALVGFSVLKGRGWPPDGQVCCGSGDFAIFRRQEKFDFVQQLVV